MKLAITTTTQGIDIKGPLTREQRGEARKMGCSATAEGVLIPRDIKAKHVPVLVSYFAPAPKDSNQLADAEALAQLRAALA